MFGVKTGAQNLVDQGLTTAEECVFHRAEVPEVTISNAALLRDYLSLSLGVRHCNQTTHFFTLSAAAAATMRADARIQSRVA
jgi:hypothetical protein